MSNPGMSNWDKEVDVLVVGSGASGMPCAIRARDAGLNVLVIDQNFDVGGKMLHSGAQVSLGGGDPYAEALWRAHWERVRAKVKGTEERPRLVVFRSDKHIYAQLVNDVVQRTIATVTDSGLTGKKTEKSVEVGKRIAEKAKAAGISKVVFDRAGYQYHGRVKALADAAREGGLEF